jgi:sugar diacid utilization regulator
VPEAEQPGGVAAARPGGDAQPGGDGPQPDADAAPRPDADAGPQPVGDDPQLGDDARPDVAALQAEIVRLNKVVQALMDRAEAATSTQGSGYGLFQTTVLLQKQVHLRTQEAEAALRDNERVSSSLAASAARDMHTLRRTAALQIQLLELLVQQKDLGELIDRVATLLDMPIVLFDAHGHTLHSSRGADSPGLARRLWSAYAARRGLSAPLGRVDGGERLYYHDILVMDRVERVLAAVAPARQAPEFADASLAFLQQLVTLDVLRRRDELAMDRRERRHLLGELLAGDGTPDELRARLADQGFDHDSVWRVVVVELRAAPAPPEGALSARAAKRLADRLLRAVDDGLSRRHAPFLSMPMGPFAVVLSALPDGRPETAATLLADLHDATARAVAPEQVVVGCSTPLSGSGGAPRGLQQAHAACIAARHDPAAGGVVLFDGLSGQFRLLDGLDEETLADIVERTFAPLLSYDAQHRTRLFETLETLFEHRLAVQETADLLHVHRNTLQKRLAHVEQLLGVDLNDIDDIVDIRLGLHAAELLGKRPSPATE